jgi:hypothetical protein
MPLKSYITGGGTLPTPSNQLVQPSPPEQQSIPSIPMIIPVMDDPPPLMACSDEDSDPDDKEDNGNGVSVNQGPPPVTTRSGRRVTPPSRMNLNAMKIKELKAKNTNNAQELREKLSSQKVRAEVLNHQFIFIAKWTHFKSCMLTGQLGKLLGNLHQ